MKRISPVMIRRIFMSIAGVTVMGASVGLFSLAKLGMDPFQVFAHGIWRHSGMSFGSCYTVLSIVMLVIVFFLDRHKIGLGTLLNVLFVGYIADGVEGLLGGVLGEMSLAGRIVLLLVALVILCFASSLYMTADLGVSVYDALALSASEKIPARFALCRIISDLLCVGIGMLLCYLYDHDPGAGGALWTTAGAGTIITAFFMGPVISFFNKTVSQPLLNQ